MTLPAAVANKKNRNENDNKSTFSNPIELSPLEGTEAADREKEQAFNSLEYLNSNEAVRCQCCSNWIRIVGRLQSPRGNRMDTIRKGYKAFRRTLS
jgi:hypothetical protein